MRLIDAEKLCELARNHINKSVDCNDIMRFPTANAQEVKHGKMKLFGPRCRKHNAVYTCSICSALVSSYYSDIGEWKYCPHCGAKLEKEGKNNDTY